MTDHGRNDPRFRCRLRVHYRMPGGQSRAGFTTDVGPRGLFILASPAPPKGKVVELDVSLPDGHEETLRGRITWSRPGTPRPGEFRGGFGVQLETPTEGWYRLCAELSS
jgi:hypothetical protein